MTEKDLLIQTLRRQVEALEAENAILREALISMADCSITAAKAAQKAVERLTGGKE